MAKYVGAIDQGTTSTRFMVFDHNGAVVGVDQKEHEQIFPSRAGWNTIPSRSGKHPGCHPRALEKAHILMPKDLAAVGITNQRETTVVWERQPAKPVYNAIVWQDTRTDQICNELAKDGGQDRFRAKVGLPLATYFSGPKVKWILDNVAWCPRKSRKGRGAVWQHRHLGDLEPDRRPQWRRACDGCDQRLPHHADEPGNPGLGSGHA